MVNLSAEEVLEVLTREFLDDKSESNDLTIDKNEYIQTRMKIGEILVKATKTLGTDMFEITMYLFYFIVIYYLNF